MAQGGKETRMMARIGSWPCVLSKQSHVKVTCFLCPCTVPISLQAARDRGFLCPNPHPRLKCEWVGVLFFSCRQIHPLPRPKSVSETRRVLFFFHVTISPTPASTPALRQRPLPLHAESTPPHAGSTPPHTASAPPPLRLWVDAPGLCALDRSPHTLCQRPRPCAMGQRSLPLRAGLMPSVSAHCVSPRPCAPHQRPLPLHLCAALHLHPCLCKCPLEDHFL